MNRDRMRSPSSEGELRELLKEVVLEMYGLYPEPPESLPAAPPGRTSSPPPAPTFSRGSTVRSGSFKNEPSAIPGRKKILVGTSVRARDRARSGGPGLSEHSRLPGESDRDYLDRRRMIRSDHRKGLGKPPETYRSAGPMSWEMGH